RAGAGHRLGDLPLPLADQVWWRHDQDALTPGQEGRRRPDVRLAAALLADDDRAAVAAQRERRGPDDVALAAQRPAQQPAEVVSRVAACRAVVEWREGPDDRRADAGFMPLD